MSFVTAPVTKKDVWFKPSIFDLWFAMLFGAKEWLPAAHGLSWWIVVLPYLIGVAAGFVCGVAAGVIEILGD